MPIKKRFIPLDQSTYECTVPRQKVTWNREWVASFESPWGIFEKFKYANLANAKDIFSFFGSPYLKSLKSQTHTYMPNWATNLLTLEGLDASLLEDVFGLYIKDVNRYNIEMLTKILPEHPASYFYSFLQFCPQCIHFGYHSIFHQFYLIRHCPFHDVPLQIGCPECQRKKLYSLTNDEPFLCECGHQLFGAEEDQSYSNIWKKSNLNELQSPLKEWIKYNLENGHHKGRFFADLNIDFEKMLTFFVQSIEPRMELSPFHKKVTSLPYRQHKPKRSQTRFIPLTDRQREIREIEFYESIYQSTRATMKSIFRYVKKLLKQHTYCINQFTHQHYRYHLYNDQAICPYAYAYVFWREHIEMFKYQIVPKFRKKPIHRYLSIDMASKQDRVYLNNTLEWIRKRDGLYDLQTIDWVLNRVMVHLMLNHFRNWLRVAFVHAPQGTIFYHVPFDKQKHLPFYVIALPEHRGYPVEFHWWDSQQDQDHIKDFISNSAHCPFK